MGETCAISFELRDFPSYKNKRSKFITEKTLSFPVDTEFYEVIEQACEVLELIMEKIQIYQESNGMALNQAEFFEPVKAVIGRCGATFEIVKSRS